MSTFLDLASDALTSIGQVGMGQSVSAEQAGQALRVCNRMMQKWSQKRLMLYTIATRPFVLSIGKQDYTVGPAAADFIGARPIFVEAAQASPLGTLVDTPVNILDKIKWGAIRDKGAVTSLAGVPSDVWPEYTFPNLTFHVWPIPSATPTLKLGTWELLQQFATVFDTVSLPNGYEEAIVQNLAMELCPYYDMPVSSEMAQLAADALVTIQAINAQGLGGALGESRLLTSANLDLPVPTGGSQQAA